MIGMELREKVRIALKPLNLTRQSELLESLELTCYALGIPRERFYSFAAMDIEPIHDPEELIRRRVSGEPLAYVIGEWDFGILSFKTDSRALIPRDDSMTCVELFMRRIPALGGEVLDFCKGSGCLGIAALKKNARISAVLCDLSTDCLALAEENAERLEVKDRVTIVQADVFAEPPFEPESFVGIICNPPYIETADVDADTREPLMALDGGEDGLKFYRRILEAWTPLLKFGCAMCFEVGYNQGATVMQMMRDAGYRLVVERKDLQGITRAVSGIR